MPIYALTRELCSEIKEQYPELTSLNLSGNRASHATDALLFENDPKSMDMSRSRQPCPHHSPPENLSVWGWDGSRLAPRHALEPAPSKLMPPASPGCPPQA